MVEVQYEWQLKITLANVQIANAIKCKIMGDLHLQKYGVIVSNFSVHQTKRRPGSDLFHLYQHFQSILIPVFEPWKETVGFESFRAAYVLLCQPRAL